MQRQINQILSIVMAACVFGAMTVRAESLDGTKWKIKVTPDKEAAAKGEKAFPDTLLFANGKVTSTACVPYGFKATSYKAEAKEGVTHWASEQMSEKEGKTVWTGEV